MAITNYDFWLHNTLFSHYTLNVQFNTTIWKVHLSLLLLYIPNIDTKFLYTVFWKYLYRYKRPSQAEDVSVLRGFQHFYSYHIDVTTVAVNAAGILMMRPNTQRFALDLNTARDYLQACKPSLLFLITELTDQIICK